MASVLPIRLAYNTVYLWEEAGAGVLVDAGPDYEGSWDALQAALDGRRPDLVVATHAHFDHSGLGRAWQGMGVPVAIGHADARLVSDGQFAQPGEFEALSAFVLASGVPADVAAEALSGVEAARARGRIASAAAHRPAGRGSRYPTGLRMDRFVPDLLLDGDEVLPGGLRAIACPGHTPGNLVLFDPGERWLFSGDQLLADITPIPGIQWLPPHGAGGGNPGDPGARDGSWRFRSLPAFVRSLERLRGLDAVRCFPGHGEPFDGVGAVIAANLAQVHARTGRVREAAADAETLWDLCERLYPRAARRRLWQIMSIVQGHLDLIAEQQEADA